MKQGSTDDPFADDPPDESKTTEQDTDAATDRHSETESTAEDSLDTARTTSNRDRSLPYIHARDGVKDGRTQRPVFLRDDVESGIGDLLTAMETELGEDVYKTDVTEAAMVVAQENPELVREKLAEWGYGW